MMRTIGLALVLSLGMGPTTFAHPGHETTEAVTFTAGADDTSAEANVNVGAHLVVKLVVAGGTGHSWTLGSEAGPELALTDQRMERTAARLGAPQAAVFDFAALAAGQKELTFNLMPPGGGDAARTYTLSVTVSE